MVALKLSIKSSQHLDHITTEILTPNTTGPQVYLLRVRLTPSESPDLLRSGDEARCWITNECASVTAFVDRAFVKQEF
jgi:hypothetical protein